MICEHCGTEMFNKTAICSACGAALPVTKASTSYGHYPQFTYYQPDRRQAPSYYHTPPPYGADSYSTTPGVTYANKNDSPLIAEIIFSLLGLFGIGWLIAGETTIGTVLLVCSIVIYWPLMIGGTVLTFGIGLLCLGPMAIGAIILNVLLLNSTLNRKTKSVT
jgi:hypothetical protein